MKLAFYKDKGDMFDTLVRWWTRPKFFKFWESARYSHVEVVFSDGLCFSASPRDKGVRFKSIDLTDGKWDVLELKVPQEGEALARLWSKGQAGKEYDWFGILFFKSATLWNGG